MQTTSDTIIYTKRNADDGGRSALWLHLEPEQFDREKYANLTDIDAMLAMAQSGISSMGRVVNRCKWARWEENGDLSVMLKLWVWPSNLDLQYSLILPDGVISEPPIQASKRRNVKFWVAGANREIELPWLMATYDPETSLVSRDRWVEEAGVWDAWSRPVDPPPAIRREGTRLILEGAADNAELYGVIHCSGFSLGYEHDLVIRYPTGDGSGGSSAPSGADAPLYVAGGGGDRDSDGPAISIEGADDFEVTAVWRDENGEEREETATMTIPDCVHNLLRQCPQGTERGGSIRVRPEGGEGPVTIWYNTCNGRILKIERP